MTCCRHWDERGAAEMKRKLTLRWMGKSLPLRFFRLSRPDLLSFVFLARSSVSLSKTGRRGRKGKGRGEARGK